jgi:hypothetical protein
MSLLMLASALPQGVVSGTAGGCLPISLGAIARLACKSRIWEIRTAATAMGKNMIDLEIGPSERLPTEL